MTPTTQTESWESDFDERFRNELGGIMPKHRDGGKILRIDLIDFIRTKLDEAYSKGREDAVEYVMAQDIWHKLKHDDFYELRDVLREARHAGEVSKEV